jgi:deazaflavin-dependent oxidoreductase (nitroreductase family)
MAAPEPTYLYLRTLGRRTGVLREIEIWCTQRDGSYYVIAEHPSSHWVQNLRVEPRVEVRVGGRQVPAMARILDPELDRELIHRVQELSQAKYGWGSGLVVELTPKSRADAP